MPPAVPNDPKMYSAPWNTPIAFMPLFRPVPTEFHWMPSQRAKRLKAGDPEPEVWNQPPA
jgi:hypothetical protein